MSGEDIGAAVAGLQMQTKMIFDLLTEMKTDMKVNHMPTAQIEDRFKAQGERIGLIEKSYSDAISRIEGTLKTMDQDVKDKFTALAIAAEKQNDRKKESPYKIIAAIAALVVIIGGVASGLIIVFNHFK